MEKLGMAGRRRPCFAGLLTGALAVLSAGRLFPADGAPVDDAPETAAQPLEVSCEIAQDTLETGRAFTVTLMVNHDAASEVTVTPPDFRDNFTLQNTRSFPLLVKNTALNNERRTVIELTLIPLEEGSLTLAPFTVFARGQRVLTPEIPLTIAPRAGAPPTFRWETPKTPLTIGEWAVFRLVASDTRGLRQETLNRLRFEPPPEAIAEHTALPFPAARNVPVIELRLLPLRTGPFTINPVNLETEINGETITLRIPPLRAAIR